MNPLIRTRILRTSAWLVVIGVIAFLLSVGTSAVLLPGCESCHTSRGLVADTTPSHKVAGADCVSCHVGSSITERARFGFYQTFGMALPLVSVKDSGIGEVKDKACTSCHDNMTGTWSSAGLKIQHTTCAKGRSCASCHSTVVHKDSLSWATHYEMDTCLECHKAEDAYKSCETCHEGSLEKERPTKGSWSVTHGPNWKTTHGMGKMSTCAACHAKGYCGRCHGAGVPHDTRFFQRHSEEAQSKQAQCSGCHEKSFCQDCHGLSMPHSTGFTKQHSSIVEKDGDKLCLNCHAETDCKTCHEKHVHPGGAIPLSPDGRRTP